MAGRSGAAVIEVELREAATSFDVVRLARAVRRTAAPPDHVLADALEAVGSTVPQMDRREGEILLTFGNGTEEPTHKIDCTTLYGAMCGTEVHMLHTQVIGVSFYLE